MTTPLVSIIIPVFNGQDFIEECIYSALNQTYCHTEIIVVDNNSIDHTVDKVLQIQEKFPEKISLFFEEKQGVSYARNKGIAHSHGQWIQFLDADDLLYSDKLERQLKLIFTSTSSPLMVAGVYHHLSEDKKIREVPLLTEGQDPYKSIAASLLGHLDSNLFHIDALTGINGFNETLKVGEDTDMIFRILCFKGTASIVYDLTPSAVYRQRNFGQLTKMNPMIINTEGLKVRLSILNLLKSHAPDYFHKNEDYFIDYVYYFIYRIGIYDIDNAFSLYVKHLGGVYIPKWNSEVISWYHIAFLNILGFRNLMKCRRWLKTIFIKTKAE
ncbi:MAG: glycosyltransferase [Saprospiraceae bacterium]|nr:glycosyltransferase [Saprospiraceae bacterium]